LSYVNPNAECPVCGAHVCFYRSPYNGRVFFVHLGPPWPKHRCTDNKQPPRRILPSATGTPPRQLPWQRDGWEPLLQSKTYAHDAGVRITGKWRGRLLDLLPLAACSIDEGSPVLLRADPLAPGFFRMSFLFSSFSQTQDCERDVFESHLACLGKGILTRVLEQDPEALITIGRFLLHDRNDPQAARTYLERAIAAGHCDSAELLVLAIILATAA
jgi:hypothetical protein